MLEYRFEVGQLLWYSSVLFFCAKRKKNTRLQKSSDFARSLLEIYSIFPNNICYNRKIQARHGGPIWEFWIKYDCNNTMKDVTTGQGKITQNR